MLLYGFSSNPTRSSGTRRWTPSVPPIHAENAKSAQNAQAAPHGSFRDDTNQLNPYAHRKEVESVVSVRNRHGNWTNFSGGSIPQTASDTGSIMKTATTGMSAKKMAWRRVVSAAVAHALLANQPPQRADRPGYVNQPESERHLVLEPGQAHAEIPRPPQELLGIDE